MKRHTAPYSLHTIWHNKFTLCISNQQADKDRTCYRLVGGVLVERTVGEVLPALEKNQDHIIGFIGLLNKQLVEKGKNLTDYREKHNITVRGENPPPAPNQQGDAADNKPSSGVLVSSWTGSCIPSFGAWTLNPSIPAWALHELKGYLRGCVCVYWLCISFDHAWFKDLFISSFTRMNKRTLYWDYF